MNKARLQILQARDQIIEDINSEVTETLSKRMDSAVYEKTLYKLLLQCLGRLMEEKVELVCRQCDVPVVEKLIPQAIDAHLKNLTKSTRCEIIISNTRFLPKDQAGGIKAHALGGKIVCDNTLDTRLAIALQDSLPALRLHLFGANPSRHFFD